MCASSQSASAVFEASAADKRGHVRRRPEPDVRSRGFADALREVAKGGHAGADGRRQLARRVEHAGAVGHPGVRQLHVRGR